jgi:hypothetical protein
MENSIIPVLLAAVALLFGVPLTLWALTAGTKRWLRAFAKRFEK